MLSYYMNVWCVQHMRHVIAYFISLLSCMHIDLKSATNMSATITELDPLKVELEWSYEEVENVPLPTCCTVEVNALNSIAPPIEIRTNPSTYSTYQATLELRYDTTYAWKVTAIYDMNTKLESEEMKFTTPSEDEGL